MALTVLLLIGLAAVLRPSAGQQPIASVSTDRPDQQKEITDVHNDFRRNVKPSASNMLKMAKRQERMLLEHGHIAWKPHSTPVIPAVKAFNNMLKKWDPIAADKAQLWAKQCSFDHSPVEERTIDGVPCGENLFMSTALTSWPDAIAAWYNEVKDFKYGTGSTTGAVTGHYTQVVWYRSSRIGCSVAHCPQGEYTYYYVCHYCPAGNIVGKTPTPYKLGSPCADCPNACDNNLCTNPCPHNDKFGNCPDLKRDSGCDHPQVKEWCPASCQCTNEII